MKNLKKITLTLIITVIFVTGIIMPEIILGTPASPAVGNWYQQFMPNIGSRNITDVFFLDSLTGWAVTNKANTDTMCVLKTTNSGDNWSIHYRKIQPGGGTNGYNRVYFINQVTGFVCYSLGFDKTTDGGITWTSQITSESFQDMFIVNSDTIWLVSLNSLTGGIFRTTNGGGNWEQQLNLGSQNPGKIYMYNGRIGFASSTAGILKTTNSGINWNVVSNDFAFSDMFFTDSLTGWKASGFVKKTTNGGINWINSPIPQGGNFLGNGANTFLNADNDTIYAVGETIITGGNPLTRGVIFRTINGGNNWTYQVPDTAIHINRYLFGKLIGDHAWAYFINATGIHTTTGGDPVWLTGIEQISSEIPREFMLFQNFPNPFNPRTIIRYNIKAESYVKLTVFDITGKEVQVLQDGNQTAGRYETDFMGKFLSSGVYFYRLEVTNTKGKSVYYETRKMLLVK